MIRRLERLALKLYPFAFRTRYQQEMLAMLDQSPARMRDVVNLMTGALSQHLRPDPDLAAALSPACRTVTSIRGTVICWLGFIGAGLGFYKTTENDAASYAVQHSDVLPPAHTLVQILAVTAALASTLAVAAMLRVTRRLERGAPAQKPELKVGAVLAQVLGWSMLAIAVATAVYSVALPMQAPALANALDGPLQANTARVSIDIQALLMFACALPALVAARRAWRAAF